MPRIKAGWGTWALALAVAASAGCAATIAPAPGGAAVKVAATGATGTAFRGVIHGLVTVDGPLVGATVRVTALDGTPLGTVDTNADVTNANGVYLIPKADTPADFRMVATGGTVNGKPFVGELRAEIRAHQQFTGSAPLNPLTTIASAYTEAHPDRSLAQAQAAVKTFLKIPQAFNLGWDLVKQPQYIDTAAYAAHVEQLGGHLRYAKQLVAELDAGGTHPLGTANAYRLQQAQLLAAPLEWLGEKVLTSIAEKLGSEAMGKLLDAAGVGDKDQAKLLEIRKQIDDLAQQVSDVKKDVDQTTAHIVASLDGGAYNVWEAETLQKLMVDNDWVTENLQDIAHLEPDEEDARVALAGKVNEYLDLHYSGDFQERWNRALAGDGMGGYGAIALWDKKVNAPSPNFFTYEQALAVQRWWNMWDLNQLTAVRFRLARVNASPLAPCGPTAVKPPPDPFRATQTIMRHYQTYRDGQLKLLRGTVLTDGYTDVHQFGLKSTKTPLAAIPGPHNFQVDDAHPWPILVERKGPNGKPRYWMSVLQPSTWHSGDFPLIGSDTAVLNDRSGIRANWGVYDTYETTIEANASGITHVAAPWEVASFNDLGHFLHKATYPLTTIGVHWGDGDVWPSLTATKFDQLPLDPDTTGSARGRRDAWIYDLRDGSVRVAAVSGGQSTRDYQCFSLLFYDYKPKDPAKDKEPLLWY
ncbi:MAG: hypothetical protein JWM80_2545 [Cyanobacteria bacterium RYN_339]|nr:hypothetical protein [Cyanobacteria bacterium RYN_339]